MFLTEEIKNLKTQLTILNEIEQYEYKIIQCKKKMKDLGLFDRKEKKALTSQINELESKIEVCNQKLSAYKETLPYKESEAYKVVFSYDKTLAHKEAIAAKLFSLGDYAVLEKVPSLYEVELGKDMNGDTIKWFVLSIKDSQALLVTKYGIDCEPYNHTNANLTWETCSLRKWLNEDFINHAFSDEEKEAILLTNVKNVSTYGTTVENDTIDKLFLLSIDEAKKYLNSLYCTPKECEATNYAIQKDADVNEKGRCRWWLRSSGNNNKLVAFVDYNGEIKTYGVFAYYIGYAVRPALWLNLESK
ncbi:MAG: DUF6273 domain-containing protein [Traorella sp.]